MSNAPESQRTSLRDAWCFDWNDWWRDDRLDALFWAAAFTWAGLVILAEATGLSDEFDWWDGWDVFLTGIGVLILSGTVLRMFLPAYRRKIVGGLILGLVILGIGIGDSIDWLWAGILLAIGAVLFLQELSRRRS